MSAALGCNTFEDVSGRVHGGGESDDVSVGGDVGAGDASAQDADATDSLDTDNLDDVAIEDVQDDAIEDVQGDAVGDGGEDATGDAGDFPDRVACGEGAEASCVVQAVLGTSPETPFGCALAGDGRVWCWGDNTHGQLGRNKRTLQASEPLDVASGDERPGGAWTTADAFVDVSVGSNFACAVVEDDANQGVWCWGATEGDRLAGLSEGNTEGVVTEPRMTAGGRWQPDGAGASRFNVRKVALGNAHGCIWADPEVANEGQVFCWGDNAYGQIGASDLVPSRSESLAVDGAFVFGARLRSADPVYAVHDLAVGARHTCVIYENTETVATGARVACWGDATLGQLGPNVDVTELVGCGPNDQRQCFFFRTDAQEPPTLPSVPLNPSGLAAPARLTAGDAHTCVVSGDVASRDVVCWGDNSHGQLGGPTSAGALTAVPLPEPAAGVNFRAVLALEAGARHTCAAIEDVSGGGSAAGFIACWGANEAGQSGDAGSGGIAEPKRVLARVGGEPITPARLSAEGGRLLALGARHSCALVASATDPERVPVAVACWGADDHGQVIGGDGGAAATELPLGLGEPALGIASGGDSVCVWGATRLQCWGLNRDHQLGQGELVKDPNPEPVEKITRATEVFAGGAHACARESDGSLKCWGANALGQAAPGAPEIVPEATPVWSSGGAPADGTLGVVALGGAHTCATFAQGGQDAIRCWGDASDLQTFDAPEPWAAVFGIEDARELSAGARHTCTFGDRGTPDGIDKVTCWGANALGQLGLGNTEPQTWCNEDGCRPPSPMGYDEAITRIAVGSDFACGAVEGGAVCWGANASDALGAGVDSGVFSARPVRVAWPDGMTVDVRMLALGRGFALALGEDGRVWGWGDNTSGQLLAPGAGPLLPAPLVERDALEVLGGGIVSVAAGDASACAVTPTGALYCWGDNARGQLGPAVGADEANFLVEVVLNP